MSTSNLQRQNDALKQIIKNSTIRVVCPICFQGFPRNDKLYKHFREQKDDTHHALDKRTTDFSTFLSCYQVSLGAFIPAESLANNPRCFDVLFVIENLGNGTEESQFFLPSVST
jgi:hypothetical protein